MLPQMRLRRGDVQAGGEEDAGADRRMWCESRAVCRTNRGDARELGDAGMAHLGLEEREWPGGETVAGRIGGVPYLAGGERERTLAAEFGQPGHVLGLDRRLDEGRAPGGELGGQRQRLGGGELPVEIDHDLRRIAP